VLVVASAKAFADVAVGAAEWAADVRDGAHGPDIPGAPTAFPVLAVACMLVGLVGAALAGGDVGAADGVDAGGVGDVAHAVDVAEAEDAEGADPVAHKGDSHAASAAYDEAEAGPVVAAFPEDPEGCIWEDWACTRSCSAVVAVARDHVAAERDSNEDERGSWVERCPEAAGARHGDD
jgi:hypothetical protein